MKKYLFTAVLLCSCTLVFNQTRLRGRVTDENGEALIGATVKLMQLDKLIRGTITDYNGEFLLREIEQGFYHIEVSYTGYRKKHVAAVTITPNMIQKLDVVMEPEENLTRCFVHQFYHPLIDQNPGNTGTTYSGYFIRNMY